MTEEQKPKKKKGCLIGCGTAIFILFFLGVIGSFVEEEKNEADKVELKSEVDKCNEGIEEVCQKLLQGNKDVSRQITNPLYKETFLEKQNQINEKQRKIKEEKEIAEAKFKAEGWWQPKKGIFVRWCKNASGRYPEKGDCPRTDTYLDTVWRMMVWCRDTRCGDIYAKINLSQTNGGPVIGWTNDTAYGDYGQKVILTFQSNSKARYADLVEFSAY